MHQFLEVLPVGDRDARPRDALPWGVRYAAGALKHTLGAGGLPTLPRPHPPYGSRSGDFSCRTRPELIQWHDVPYRAGAVVIALT
jgi:hypothetical protein